MNMIISGMILTGRNLIQFHFFPLNKLHGEQWGDRTQTAA